MTFKEAREKLEEMAAYRTFSLSYQELHHNSDGSVDVQCCISIHTGHDNPAVVSSYRNGPAGTWEDAFENLTKNFNDGGDVFHPEQAPE